MGKTKKFSEIILHFRWKDFFPYLFVVLIAYSLKRTHGLLKFNHLIFLTLGTFIFFVLVQFRKKSFFRSIQFEKIITLIFCVFSIIKTDIIYPEINLIFYLYKFTLIIVVIALLMDLKGWLKINTNLLLFNFGVLICLFVPFISPSPRIDVYTILTEASHHLLNFVNPYLQTYPDIYAGEYRYEPNLIYWPFGLVFNAISLYLLKDIRLILSICVAFSMYFMYRKKDYLFLLIAFFPVTVFIIEQAWIEAVLVPLFVLLHKLLKEQKVYWSAIILGFICATKQFTIITAILSFFFIFKQNGLKVALKYAMVSFLVGLSIMLPFVYKGFESFIQNTVYNVLAYPLREDTLSWLAYFSKVHLITIPSSVSMGVSLIALFYAIAYLIYRKSKPTLLDLEYSQIISYMLVFLFGKQAFCNYYFLIFIFMVLYISELSFKEGR